MKKQILVATTNAGKISELAQMLSALSADVQWLSLKDFPSVEPVTEDGKTFQENARKKALGYAQQTGLWTIADDSGLVVDALDGAPGVHSARFCGSTDSDRAVVDRKNNEKLLSLLTDVAPHERTARFQCCICLAQPGTVLAESTGTVEGQIAGSPRGDGGFGYDPLFYIPNMEKTAAQLAPQEKNAISHRGNAVRNLMPAIARLLLGQ